MEKSKKILQLVQDMARYAALLSTAALLVILVVILIGVFFRVMRLPIGGIIEINQFLIVISIFLGFAYLQHQNSHIKVEVLMSWYPPFMQRILPILTNVLAFLFFSAIMYGGIIMGIKSYLVGEYEFGLRAVPVWIIRAFVPLGSLAALIVVVVDLIRDIAHLIKPTRSPRKSDL